MPSTRINGVDLYYECHGSGTPLMLIAGLASDSQSWLPIVEALSQQHLVILPDNRGVGRTRPQEAETSIGHIADDCMALVQQLGLSSVALLGHSMGGFAALDCARRYPDRVSRLILAATSAFSSRRNRALLADWSSSLQSDMDPEHWWRNVFYWILSRTFFEDSRMVADAVRYAIEYPYPQSKGAFANQVQAIAEFDCQKELPAIRQKTLVVCGKEDLLFPAEESLKVLQKIPDTEVAVIEGAAHSIHMEQPTPFTECVLQFLRTG